MIKYVVFDIAGVLIQDQWVSIVRTLLNDKQLNDKQLNDKQLSKQDVFELWQRESCFHDYETGKISTDVFISQAKTALNLTISDQQFKELFDQIIITPFKRAEEVLSKVKSQFNVAILSNTNPMHYQKILNNFNIYQHCEHLFLSHQMGVMKPSGEIFSMMLKQLHCKAQHVLFFDDNMPNVLAARKLGINSELITCPEDAYYYIELHSHNISQ
ncbi:HAD family hydrolase [Marinicellulosiphila megalodicopiae]|uniref:HAD family hydrolase n=1 Tax=Marinicellulosiphila megalodicopiae TaxID=2724896 RepID=UPI003BB1B395